MRPVEVRRYVVSCGLLLLPLFLWNIVFAGLLPAPLTTTEFWRDIPAGLRYAENSSRLVVSALPFLMPLELTSPVQRRGLWVYCLGVAVYFAGWVPLMVVPNSSWVAQPAGFFAPAYTPLLWLTGLALLGQRLHWGRWYRWWMFLVPGAVFVAAHVTHTAVVYARSQ